MQRAGGGSTCAVDIPHWSFHWQGSTTTSSRSKVAGGDVVHLACSFDNTAGTAPLTWGEKTSDEMCLAFAYVTAQLSAAVTGSISGAGARVNRFRGGHGHNRAAPRTPLASPCAARTSFVRRSLGRSTSPTASGRSGRCDCCWRRRRPARSRAGREVDDEASARPSASSYARTPSSRRGVTRRRAPSDLGPVDVAAAEGAVATRRARAPT